MTFNLLKLRRSPLALLLLALLINLTTTGVFAGAWAANDAGNDNPDGQWWWFAPESVYHELAWYDEFGPGLMDQVLDHHMRWGTNTQYWFRNQPDANYVHEVRTDNLVYEANDWYWTNLPTPQKNEDDNDWEEGNQGYEEKELGWENPSTDIPNGPEERMVYTGFDPVYNGNAYFESESELTKCYPVDCWLPDRWDILGRMNIYGAE